jgi:multiple sugar transport system permease protein
MKINARFRFRKIGFRKKEIIAVNGVKRAARHPEGILLLLALPSLLGLFGFYVVPFIISLYLAVIENPVSGTFVGLKNFIEVLSNGAFLMALKNTAQMMLISIPLNMILPLCMALLLKHTAKLRNFCGIIFLLPLVIPSGSIVYFWKSLFSVSGFLNGVFFPGAPVDWLNSDWSRSIILLIFLWKNAGYNMVLFLAGLNMIPKDYYECAAIEGAGVLRRFFSITLVYMIPTCFLVLIMSIINSFKSFKEIYLLTGSYPHNSIYMIQHYMNNQFSVSNYQKLASASYVLSAAVIVLVAVIFYLQNKAAKNL